MKLDFPQYPHSSCHYMMRYIPMKVCLMDYRANEVISAGTVIASDDFVSLRF